MFAVQIRFLHTHYTRLIRMQYLIYIVKFFYTVSTVAVYYIFSSHLQFGETGNL